MKSKIAWTLAFGLTAGLLTACETASEGGGGVSQRVKPAATVSTGKPFDLEALDLDARRLEWAWDVYLGEEILGVWQREDAIYVYTRSKGQLRLYSINVVGGVLRWQYNIPDGLSYAPSVFKYADDGTRRTDELLLISQDQLHVVDLEGGFLLWKHNLPFASASAASASDSHIYVGAWDDRIYAISKSRHVVDWSYRTAGPVTNLSTVPERKVSSVFVNSEDGAIYALNQVHEERKWHYKTRGALRGAPLYYKEVVYVASRDMNLYSIGAVKGDLVWKYAAGSPLSEPPAALDSETLVQRADDDRMLVINRRGRDNKYLRWETPGVAKVLAEGKNDIFALDTKGDVRSFDQKEGTERWAEPMTLAADYYTFNPYDAGSRKRNIRDLSTVMVVGYRSGWLLAVKEKTEY